MYDAALLFMSRRDVFSAPRDKLRDWLKHVTREMPPLLPTSQGLLLFTCQNLNGMVGYFAKNIKTLFSSQSILELL